jgi:YhcH/YjgK/YiaL family protein
MIYGHLSARDTYGFLFSCPAWKTAFDWLGTVTTDTPMGRTLIAGEEVYANVHGYETLPAEDCPFESHRRFVDLQYCIAGGETIEWSLVSGLKPNGDYNEANDIQFYTRPGPAVTGLKMAPGSFAVFFPSDGHAPKVEDRTNRSVFKVVIKVNARLLTGSKPG